VEDQRTPDTVDEPNEEARLSGQDVALAQTKFILWVTLGGIVFLGFYIFVLAFGRS
jgi:hypothetical protein